MDLISKINSRPHGEYLNVETGKFINPNGKYVKSKGYIIHPTIPIVGLQNSKFEEAVSYLKLNKDKINNNITRGNITKENITRGNITRGNITKEPLTNKVDEILQIRDIVYMLLMYVRPEDLYSLGLITKRFYSIFIDFSFRIDYSNKYKHRLRLRDIDNLLSLPNKTEKYTDWVYRFSEEYFASRSYNWRYIILTYVEQGYLGFLEMAIRRDLFDPMSNINGYPSLYYFVENNAPYQSIRMLLEEGVDPNEKHINGLTAIFPIIRRNRLDLIELLVEYGANLHVTTDKSMTTLIEAVLAEVSDDILIYLCQSGVNIRATDNCGKTALFYEKGLASLNNDFHRFNMLKLFSRKKIVRKK